MKRRTQDAGRRTKIILALDVDSLGEAKYFVDKLYPTIKIFKVGPQLFTSCGPKIIEYIIKRGAGVFLDLKFYDIPNTVACAVRQAVRLKVGMLTLHIAGGEEMLKQATGAAQEESRKLKLKQPLLIGVTVLTSQEANPNNILKLTKIGLDCGLDGVICSVKEVSLLRGAIKKKFMIVTPGIRPGGFASYDQKRTATVRQALKAGSNFLVIGRPILEAGDPVKALKELI